MHYFHITTRAEWAEAQAADELRPATLESEGFVHCSLAEQVVATANRFFRGRTDLLLLRLDAWRLRPRTRFEPAEGQLFPHVYGPLNLDAVSGAFAWLPGADGAFAALPDGAV